MLYRKSNQVEIQTFKVIPGDHVTSQHRLVTLDVDIKVTQRQTGRRIAEKKIKWFKLKNNEISTKFRERVLNELDQEMYEDHDINEWWNRTNGIMLRIGKEVVGESKGKIIKNKET